MKTLLQINAGIQGEHSQSSILADKLVATLLSNAHGCRHIKRDLSVNPIPHLDHGTFQAFADPAAASMPRHEAGLALSDTLIAELKQSDTLVLGSPMYNLMIPSTLKSWIDYVTRAGHTFQFSESGPVGLLQGKNALVIIAQGGKFLGTSSDLETPYIQMALGLIGITDIEFIYAEGLAMGPEAADTGRQAAFNRISAFSL